MPVYMERGGGAPPGDVAHHGSASSPPALWPIARLEVSPYCDHTGAQIDQAVFNFSITKVARENITFQILDIPLGEPSEQDIQRIRDARPRWMLKIEKNRRLFEGI
jgi:hypothetical protein